MLKSALFAFVFVFTSFSHAENSEVLQNPDCGIVDGNSMKDHQIQFSFRNRFYLDNFGDGMAPASSNILPFVMISIDPVPGGTSILISEESQFIITSIEEGSAIVRTTNPENPHSLGRLYRIFPAPSSNPWTMIDFFRPSEGHITPIVSDNLEILPGDFTRGLYTFCSRNNQNVIPASATGVEETEETSIAL
jgi:hypothetical protein